MNRVWIWYRRRAVAASGAAKCGGSAVKITVWSVFAANDSKAEKKH
jgi:hypothetical protein